MIIECPACHSKYQYDEERFERKPSKKIKCAKCQNVFDIHNPAFAPKPIISAPVGDRTYASRTEPRTKAISEATEQSMLPSSSTEEDPRRTSKTDTLQLPEGKRLSLAILDGPDAGSVYRIDKPRITIGRSNADLTLNDTEASRQHAVLEIRDQVCTVADLGSTNGTMVDGARINEPVEITDKSEFQIGTTTLMLIITEDG